MRKWKALSMVLVLIFGLPLISGACAQAPQSLDEFYAENRVTTITPDVATSTTAYANRIFAAYWPDETGGGQLLVKEIPEGDGMVGMNKLYTSDPDGLTIASGVGWSFGLYAPHVAQKPGMEYELDKFNYIGALAVEQPMLSVSPTLGVKTVADLKKIKNFRWGCGGDDQASAIWGALLINWLGLEGGKLVTGWETGELGIALASGEVHAASFGGPSTMDWADSGLTQPLATMGSMPDVGFPEIPTFPELFQMTPEQLSIFKINDAYGASFRTWMAPPGLPQDKLDFLQDTFVKITDNEGFRRQYRRRWDHFSRLTGPELEAFVAEALVQPTTRIEELIEFTRSYISAR